ncbi:MAG: glycosyltransferase family 1 protein [Candidatus Hydrogenedentota bacterium]|nr:MAG: glycosyltransferase family 1 protein [Candidatus Hydrogenedentota bacterium]
MMNRPKVVHISEPAIDGVKTHYINFLLNSNVQQFDYSLIYSNARVAPDFFLDLEKCRARGIDCQLLYIHPNISLKKDLTSFYDILSLFRKMRPDIVHAHSSKAGFLARFAAAYAGAKAIIYTPNAFPFQIDRNIASKKLFLFLEKLAARVTDKIICVSHSERELALKLGLTNPRKIEVIYNGVDHKKFESDYEERIRIRSDLGIGLNDFVVVTVARMSYQKCPHHFVRVASEVLSMRSDIRFLYVGDGEYRSDLQELARNLNVDHKISFLGYRNDVRDILVASDLFLSTSRYEGLPIAALEAMAAGLPIIATDVTGNKDIVVNGKTGYLAKFGDIQQMAEKIILLSSSRETRKKMGNNAKQVVIEKFSINAMVKKIEQLYLALLSQKGYLSIETAKEIGREPQLV